LLTVKITPTHYDASKKIIVLNLDEPTHSGYDIVLLPWNSNDQRSGSNNYIYRCL